MFQVRQGSPYPKLADAWSGAAVDETLLDATREALASVQPADLGEVRPLTDVLLRALAGPLRAPARQCLFTVLDAVRRRFFVQALKPEAVDGWLQLLLPVVERADYTFGELLRSREATDPRTIALRVLGTDACELTVADLARRTRAIARGLLALAGDDADLRVAILSENGLE